MHTILLIRHGRTAGNLEKRYIGGQSDEPLCPQGISELLEYRKRGYYPAVDQVCSSDMRRCLETAHLIYGSQETAVFFGLRECDFGLFEGKSYEQLKNCRSYQYWLDSGGTIPFPEGEDPGRILPAFTTGFFRVGFRTARRSKLCCYLPRRNNYGDSGTV